MVNMENHVSEMLSSREENVCSEPSENFLPHLTEGCQEEHPLKKHNGALTSPLFPDNIKNISFLQTLKVT